MSTIPCWTTIGFGADLGDRLEQAHSAGGGRRALLGDIRGACASDRDFADYLGSLQAFRTGLDDDPQLLRMSEYLLEYPFSRPALSAGAGGHRASARASAGRWCCRTATWCSNRARFSAPASGMRWTGRCSFTCTRNRCWTTCIKRYPASHYVMVDDKPNLLAAMKSTLGEQADHGIRAPGALRTGRGVERRATAARSGDRAHRRS